MEVRSLTDAKLEDSPWKVILYGQAGAGKIHLMREFPKPLLLMDFDDKHEPLIGVEGIDVVSYFSTEPKESPKIFREFWKDLKGLKKENPYQTIVIDSLTALDKILVRTAVIEGGRGEMARAEIQHYGDVKNWYTTIFQAIRGLQNVNVVIIAHEDYKIDSDSGLHAILPLVTGSTSNEVASIFKDTWYLELKKTANGLQRILHYSLFKKCVCTSTTLAGDGSIVDPTYEKLMQTRRKTGEANGKS